MLKTDDNSSLKSLYKASMEDVLHFFKSGRKAPPSFQILDKVTKRKRIHSLSEYSRNFVFEDNTLYYKFKPKNFGDRELNVKVLFSRKEIEHVLSDVHGQGASGSHMGEKRTQSIIRQQFYWRGMTQDVKHWIATCSECQKARKIKTATPKPHRIYAKKPWDIVDVGLVGPFKPTSLGFKYILTGTCLFSKWVEAEPLVDKSSEWVLRGLLKWIHRWGIPLKILTAQTNEFDNKKLNELIFKHLNISHLVTSAYHPQTNSQNERINETINHHISEMVNTEQDDWDMHLSRACWQLRSAYNESIKMTPFEVMTSRKPPTSELSAEEASPVTVDDHDPNEVAAYVQSIVAQLNNIQGTPVVLVNNNENEAKEKQQKHHKLKKLKDRKTLTFHGPKVNRTKMKMFGGRKGEASKSTKPLFQRRKRLIADSESADASCADCSDLSSAAQATDPRILVEDAPPPTKRMCTRVKLTADQESVLLGSDRLCDDIIDKAQGLLASQCPQIGGFQNAFLFGASPAQMSASSPVKPWIQILHVNGNHWVTASNIRTEGNTVTIYDTRHPTTFTTDNIKQLSMLSRHFTKDSPLRLKFANVQRHVGANDCGLFAVAMATALAWGEDPSLLVFEQARMRKHLLDCFRRNLLLPFPNMQRKMSSVFR